MRKELLNMFNYSDNWDGYGVKKYKKRNLKRADKIISKLLFSPEIFPSPNSTISLEYSRLNKITQNCFYENYLWIKLESLFKASAFIIKNDKETEINYVFPSIKNISKIVNDFMNN